MIDCKGGNNCEKLFAFQATVFNSRFLNIKSDNNLFSQTSIDFRNCSFDSIELTNVKIAQNFEHVNFTHVRLSNSQFVSPLKYCTITYLDAITDNSQVFFKNPEEQHHNAVYNS